MHYQSFCIRDSLAAGGWYVSHIKVPRNAVEIFSSPRFAPALEFGSHGFVPEMKMAPVEAIDVVIRCKTHLLES